MTARVYVLAHVYCNILVTELTVHKLDGGVSLLHDHGCFFLPLHPSWF
jgi:hypothetical protein